MKGREAHVGIEEFGVCGLVVGDPLLVDIGLGLCGLFLRFAHDCML